jgi:hypothetical protein
MIKFIKYFFDKEAESNVKIFKGQGLTELEAEQHANLRMRAWVRANERSNNIRIIGTQLDFVKKPHKLYISCTLKCEYIQN